ncbi:MAG TPA: VWA domain-containing protein [Candidatus Nanopelagicaceae bacterium]|nr:VWA domain-containing protein [Candidatus Nanopelagicaceae bacterium]
MSNLDAPSFDPAIVGFTRILGSFGFNINQHRIHTAYRCFGAFGGVQQREHVYWAGRFALCSRREDIVVYDRIFEAWFDGRLPEFQRQNISEVNRTVATPDQNQSDPDTGSDDLESKKTATASEIEILRNADLALLSLDERSQVEEWITQLRPTIRTRQTRRFSRGKGNLIDRRTTIRAALAAGGEMAELAFRKRRHAPRKVLFLIDVSGSMKAYSSAYLRFAYATKQTRSTTEIFTIGTRLTRVTKSLSKGRVQNAINRALKEIPDWSGGTRLGSQLREFVKVHGARGEARGAILVIASDGWERGDVQLLGASMAHLSRLAKRIIWVNPHVYRPGFAPLTAGMEISLPNIDRLVDGHSYRSFENLCRELMTER